MVNTPSKQPISLISPNTAEWVNPRNRTTPGVFTICLWRKDPLGSASGELRKRQLNGLTVAVETVSSEAELSRCDIAFFTEGFTDEARGHAATLERERVLTVSEESLSGVLNFQILDGQVRFDCNLEIAARSGIKLGSQLLKLAERVKGGT